MPIPKPILSRANLPVTFTNTPSTFSLSIHLPSRPPREHNPFPSNKTTKTQAILKAVDQRSQTADKGGIGYSKSTNCLPKSKALVHPRKKEIPFLGSLIAYMKVVHKRYH
jgi:hypothetical protein